MVHKFCEVSMILCGRHDWCGKHKLCDEHEGGVVGMVRRTVCGLERTCYFNNKGPDWKRGYSTKARGWRHYSRVCSKYRSQSLQQGSEGSQQAIWQPETARAGLHTGNQYGIAVKLCESCQRRVFWRKTGKA